MSYANQHQFCFIFLCLRVNASLYYEYKHRNRKSASVRLLFSFPLLFTSESFRCHSSRCDPLGLETKQQRKHALESRREVTAGKRGEKRKGGVGDGRWWGKRWGGAGRWWWKGLREEVGLCWTVVMESGVVTVEGRWWSGEGRGWQLLYGEKAKKKWLGWWGKIYIF